MDQEDPEYPVDGASPSRRPAPRRATTPASGALAGLTGSADAIAASLARFTSPIQLQLDRFYSQSAFSVLEQLRKQVEVNQFKMIDAISPAILKNIELASTARIAGIASSAATAGWRQSLVTEELVKNLAAGYAFNVKPASSLLIADLNRYASISTQLSERIALSQPRTFDYAALHSRPALQLTKYVAGLYADDDTRRLAIGARASQGVASLTAFDSISVDLTLDREDEKSLIVEDSVVAPWVNGPVEVRADLMAALRVIDPEIAHLLEGAWEDVQRAGPAAIVKIATCAVEALERTLRTLAPDPIVLPWLRQSGAKIDDNYRPTQAERVRYLLRGNKSERKLIVVQTEAISQIVPELRSRLQASKHASAGHIPMVRLHLMTVETVLAQIVLSQQTFT